MKLKECLEMGKRLGLTTVKEAYINVDRHCMNLFVYSQMVEEMNEITVEYNELYNSGLIRGSMSVEDALKLELK